MYVDITDIITEIKTDIEFKIETNAINEFGVPVLTEVVKKISSAFIEKNVMDTNRQDGDPFMTQVGSVWIDRKDVPDPKNFIGATFEFSEEFFEVTGVKNREKLSSHIEFLVKKRIDIR